MYKKYDNAANLPLEWDEFCRNKNVYMKSSTLKYMEEVNYCHQSYYAFYKDDKIYSCFMMFEQKFNLFIFTKFKIKCRIKFIYLPLSAAESSVIFDEDTSEIAQVLNKMKGIKLFLNTNANERVENFTQGYYLPVCILKNKWQNFEEYMNSLRSNYRRRYNQAMKRGQDISFEILKDNNDFNESMYHLYEQVFNHAEYSLEKLNCDFFKNSFSKIICLIINGQTEAFVQIIEDNETLIFEFGGYNYDINHQYDLYHNMLLEIIRYGIKNNFKYIHLGQTAYDCKLKFGAEMSYKYLLLSHSNKFINWIIKKTIRFLEYKVETYDFNVFKEREDK